jgi:indole-3-glycerol phosphate synthase
VARFSQAISEGDGISVIPILAGDVARLAATAEETGAEAVAVATPGEAAAARAATGLPIVLRGQDAGAASDAGADALIVLYDPPSGEGELLEEQHALARELGLDCAVDVRDEHALEEALERVDPDIILISERDPQRGEEELERTLDLLPDVPAGKLVISESGVFAREQVLALERAGIDAILVAPADGDFGAQLAELTGRNG